ncbi:unnamed protein product [Lactuca saligna]|uniref:Uncharacterized protein n=1 Tax=Lactuca saligna TaxID=75948 RepID=A0AA35VL03_LACSI|nr:unnamed protein product [Lactuca saligna]
MSGGDSEVWHRQRSAATSGSCRNLELVSKRCQVAVVRSGIGDARQRPLVGGRDGSLLLTDWKRLPRSKEMAELEGLEVDVAGTTLSVSDHMWVWKGSSSGLFLVSSLRGLMVLNQGANCSMADFQWISGHKIYVSDYSRQRG